MKNERRHEERKKGGRSRSSAHRSCRSYTSRAARFLHSITSSLWTAPHEAYELILDPFISFPFRFLTAAPVGHSPFRYARSVPSSLRGVRNGNGDDERRETAGKMTILTTFLSPLFLISFILYHFGRSPVTPSAQRMKRMRWDERNV